MWNKLKDQLPVIIITAALVIGAAYWFHTQNAERQQAEMAVLRQEKEADRKAAAEQTDLMRRQISDMDALLKDAIAKRSADVFMTQDEVAKMNNEKVDQLAEAIAKKVQPYNPLPKSPEEAERMQNEQVDKVSSRMAEKISPILNEMANDQNKTRESINKYSQRISDQVGMVLTSELAKNQQLQNKLTASQANSRDAMKLTHEVTALYLSSFKDQGLITRLLSLPANVIRDATSLSIVNSTERQKLEQRYIAEMAELEKRIVDVEGTGAAASRTPVATAAPTTTPAPKK